MDPNATAVRAHAHQSRTRKDMGASFKATSCFGGAMIAAPVTLTFGVTGELELDLDISNLTNTNTTWEMRALTGRLNVRQDGDPNGQINNIQQFLSPSQILGPRIARLGFAFRF